MTTRTAFDGRWDDAICRRRRAILFDIENIVGDPDAAPEEFLRAWDSFVASPVGCRPGDLVFVGCSSHAATIAATVLWDQPVLWCVRDGADGADHALIDAVDIEHLSGRYGTLVVASGDEAFLVPVAHAQACGMDTHLVTGRGWCSYRLYLACDTVTDLRLDRTPAVALAA